MKDSKYTAEDRRILLRILIDLIILLVLVTPIIICEFVIHPFRRGFFCDDETIRYPYHKNTINTLTLSLFISLVPALIVSVIEYARYMRRGRRSDALRFYGMQIPIWLAQIFKHAWYYTFGGLLVLNATELGKYTIGRLRPHFMAVCQPQLLDGSSCDAPQNLHRYIEDYTCLSVDYDADVEREARLSFPSGHSSLSFYAMIYMVIYLHHKFSWRGSKFMRYTLQFVCLMAAFFVALTRIIDNWHHWSDVLFGSLLGIVGALLTARYITKEFGTPLLDRLHANMQRQNTTTTLDEIADILPATYTERNGNGGVRSATVCSVDEVVSSAARNDPQYVTKV